MSDVFSVRTISVIAAANHQSVWIPAKAKTAAGKVRVKMTPLRKTHFGVALSFPDTWLSNEYTCSCKNENVVVHHDESVV